MQWKFQLFSSGTTSTYEQKRCAQAKSRNVSHMQIQIEKSAIVLVFIRFVSFFLFYSRYMQVERNEIKYIFICYFFFFSFHLECSLLVCACRAFSMRLSHRLCQFGSRRFVSVCHLCHTIFIEYIERTTLV